ncbi:MAG: hypothetical protein KF803_10885 [Cyclobacteriaceae bacterium]|nr:hypothetical protein [Cyclobacteriaceae bacterium]
MDNVRKNKTINPSALPATEPDYYLENGKVVFTASFHLKRGYCCQSGCRHCPYKESVNK